MKQITDMIMLSTKKPRNAKLRFIAFTGETLSDLRKDLSINQSELADNLGVNRTMVSHWEKGSEKPNYERLQQLGQFFSQKLKYKIVFYAEWEDGTPPDYWGRD